MTACQTMRLLLTQEVMDPFESIEHPSWPRGQPKLQYERQSYLEVSRTIVSIETKSPAIQSCGNRLGQ
jgi:hypothetical protein